MDDGTAISYLTNNDWKIEAAINCYYENPEQFYVPAPVPSVDRKKLDALFNKYRDSVEEDKILAEGVSRICCDLKLDPTSVTVLIFAWKLQAATQCEFTRSEFVDGMTRLGCDSIEKLRKRCETLDKEIQDPQNFKDFYLFTFNFAKNPGQKGLGMSL
jgi:DCN1-like protein 1/2